jgi:uncharacterized repeat protein (TIGR02543 family)
LDSVSDGDHIFKVKANGDGVSYTTSSYSDDLSVTLEGGAIASTGYYSQFDDLTKNESFLGYGFDVINSSSFSDQLIKTSSPLFTNEGNMAQRLVKVDSKYTTVEEVASSSMEEFIEEWNANANVDVSWGNKKIGGSVKLKTSYKGGLENAKSKYFHSISFYNQKFYIVMQSDLDTYRSILADGFKKDLYSDMEPADLFNRYGTHFITSAIMGGKINSYYLYTSEEEKDFHKISASVSTEVRAFSTKANASVSSGYKQEAQSQNIDIQNTLEVIGGGDFGMTSDADIATNYAAWEKSLDDHASLMGIKDTGSLWSIWELIDPTLDTKTSYSYTDADGVLHTGCTRSEQLQGYFQAYGIESYNSLMETAGLPEIVTPDEIVDIKVNNQEATNGTYTVYAGTTNNISFGVKPYNATGYTKTISLAQNSDYVKVGDDGMSLEIDPACENGTVLQVNCSVGTVKQTIRVKVIRNYSIDFVLNGGTLSEEQIEAYSNLPYGTWVETPPAPTREGYTFLGWYTDMNFNTPYEEVGIDRDFTLYAKWEKYYPTITFIHNVAGSTLDSAKVAYNTAFAEPEEPTLQGYTFDGFYADKEMEVPFDFTQNIITDTNIYVKWNVNIYTVSFETNGGNSIADQQVNYNEKATRPADPIKTGYTFEGFYADKEMEIPFDFTQNIITDTNIYVKWIVNTYTVSFETNGGNSIADQQVNYNEKATRPEDPKKTGYTFEGFYADEEYKVPFDFTQKITEDTKIYAKWIINTCKVNFVTIDGVVTDSEKVNYNQKATRPADPTKTGYTFGGFYADKEMEIPFDFTQNIITDTNIYVKWNVNTYTVSFETNGGNSIADQQVNYNEKATRPEDPTKIGCEFGNWYKDSALTNQFDFKNDVIESDTTLYASWISHPVEISYDTNGGKEIDSIRIESDTAIGTLPTPERAWYTFIGWFTATDEEVYPTTIFISNQTIYAKWEQEYTDYTYLSTADDLKAIESTGNYLLVSDIDMEGISWTPISTFSGIFDGGGHKISNISTTANSGVSNGKAYSGGFIQINSGTIKSVVFENITVNTSITQYTNDNRYFYVGGVVGYNSGTINNIVVYSSSVYGELLHQYDQNGAPNLFVYVGGLLGYNTNCLTNCYVEGTTVFGSVDAKKNYCLANAVVGGVCAESNSDANVSYLISCNNTIKAKSRGGFWGGLWKNDGALTCYSGYVLGVNFGAVSNIISCNQADGSINNLFENANDNPTHNSYSGMLIARSDTAVTNGYSVSGNYWMVGNNQNMISAMADNDEILNSTEDWTASYGDKIVFKWML